jgi:UDP-glucose 4-epimerase
MVEKSVKKFVFSSTCSTYGNAEYIPIDELHPQNPINTYGFTKYVVERMLIDFDLAYGIKSIVLRYFNASGADDELEIGEDHNPETHLIQLLLLSLVNNQNQFSIYGDDYDTEDGTCVRDFIHVNDIANAHYLSMNYLNSNHSSNTFNLGTQKGYSIKEIIKEVEMITGHLVSFDIKPKRPGDPATLIASNQKAVQELNWKPENSNLTFILKTSWDWIQKNTSIK